MNHGTKHLHQRDPEFHTSEAVKRANQKADDPSQKPVEKIAHFLARYKRILQPQTLDSATQEFVVDTVTQKRNLSLLLPRLFEQLVIQPQHIPYSAFELEQRIAENLGHGTIELTDEFIEQKTKQIIADQKESLQHWITYLTSPDAVYPDYAKYWAFTGIQTMGKLVKKEQPDGTTQVYFAKRTKDTVAPYPTCNAAALAMAISAFDEYLQQVEERKKLPKAEQKNNPIILTNTSTQLTDQEFYKLIATTNFSAIYTQFLKELPEYSEAGLQDIRGTWVMYPKGSSETPLVESLKGHPLEWCTRNTDTAKTHLQGGDFYVYYSFDQNQKPTIPRIAIRMEANRIAEVRGIAPDQELDPYIAPVVYAKMQEFGTQGEQYQKKAKDMQKMTKLTQKQQRNEPFTKEELEFLYEMNYTIEGFGYKKDPRIAELRSQRNSVDDAQIIFDYTKEQIATTQEQISATTKAYIGPLTPNIFTTLQAHNIQYIYTQFPERPITFGSVEIGQYTAEELPAVLTERGYSISDYAQQMLQNKDQFITPVNTQHKALAGTTETVHTVVLQVQALGFTSQPTTTELFAKAKELGLGLCPPETGPYLRLQDKDQSMDTGYCIAMEPVANANGRSCVFECSCRSYGRLLSYDRAWPSHKWFLDYRIVFRVHK
jgi:hypothetical protein